jgi:diguanylate cyclase (GGDEF)-like protein
MMETGTKKRILIVEDEALIAMELKDRLEGLGYAVCGRAAHAETALEHVVALRPDLVLMDISLAGKMNGVEAAARIRDLSESPVVFLSAYSDPTLIARAAQSGSFGYLVKPFEERELCATIEMALARHAEGRRLRAQTVIDPLTGLHNRRFLDEALPRELARAQREGSELAVAMLDIDYFKQLNDTHGHDAGDQVLRAVAEAIRDALRESDLVCRFGGEEFTVLLPATKPEHAPGKVQAVCDGIRAMRIAYHGAELRVTLSAGVAMAPRDGISAEAVVRAADAALYRAKREGRDRVCVAEPSGSAAKQKLTL